MDCDRARVLMAETLDAVAAAPDGASAPAAAAHVSLCSSCSAWWRRLRAADALLRSEPLRHPPPHFTSRVMHRLAAAERRRPAWRATLMEVGALVSGAVTLMLGLALVVHGWGLTMAGTWIAGEVVLCGRGLALLAGALWGAAMREAAVVSLDLLLAAAVAVGWFGALIVPRWAVRRAR